MKKRSLIALLMLAAVSTATFGCDNGNNQSTNENLIAHAVTIASLTNGKIEANVAEAKKGETVTLTISPDVGYSVVEGSLKVNGNVITNETFTMPDAEAVVSCEFECKEQKIEVTKTALSITATSELKGATAHISTTFGDKLNVNVVVEDEKIILRDDFNNGDGVKIMFSKFQSKVGYIDNVTSMVQVKPNGDNVLSVYNGTAFEAKSLSADNYTCEVKILSDGNKKLAGYSVSLSIDYSVLGLTKDNAKGNLTMCPVLMNNNSNSKIVNASTVTPAEFSCVENNQNSYVVVTDDNTYILNNYIYGSAQLAALEDENNHWDLSQDYAPTDPNYENRKVVLNGTIGTGSDNGLFFFRTNATKLYTQATFKASNIYENDNFPKFGYKFVDEYNNGFFFFVDLATVNPSAGASAITTNKYAGFVTVSGGQCDWGTESRLAGSFIPASQNIELAVHRDGEKFELIVNDVKVQTLNSPKGITAESLIYPKLVSLNVALEVTNYLATDNVTEIESYLPVDKTQGNVFGSVGNFSVGPNWDVSNEKDGIIKLTGHDGNDNDIFFKETYGGKAMYAEAKFKLTDIVNPEERYGKFGLMLFNNSAQHQAGCFYYVDALVGNENAVNVNNITGTALGYNAGANGWGSWLTIAGTDGSFNLTTKVITLKMACYNNKVYLMKEDNSIIQTLDITLSANAALGIKSFGFALEVTDFYATKDVNDEKFKAIIDSL